MEKMTVLVVDDTAENIQILSAVLSKQYRVKAAVNGERALEIAGGSAKPDIILLDIVMPEMDGFEVCRRLKADPVTAQIPVIFVTAKSEIVDEQTGFEIGAVDYITKPVSPAIVKARIKSQLSLYKQQRLLEQQVLERTKQLEKNQLELIQCLGRAAEYKDNETGMHVIRMSSYSRLLAQAYRANTQWCNLLFEAAPMHDVGKIGIADSILCKPGKLDADEYREMQRHAEYGVKILGGQDSPLLKLAREVAVSHHEKWDGSGYPNGLAGEQIPLSGRIVAIADVFDALTSERPYKKAWSVEKACGLLRREAGAHFDPHLVPLFLQILPEVLKVKNSFTDNLESRVC
ncbi:response regulator [Psychromonas aquimarina]|uniref:response regulator n=1 Tax=Psychromonas aquimarina TaxID=444919 RepID=UPI001B7FE679|nr:two-component system response regulator [Psychromonas aquimarina]